MSETNDQRIYDRCIIRVGQLEAENAKLREQIHWLEKGDILHVLTDQEYIDQCERERLMQVSIDALDKENAKLRELAALNWEWAHGCCGTRCKMQTDGCGYGIDRECNYEREIWERMRELGIEVVE